MKIPVYDEEDISLNDQVSKLVNGHPSLFTRWDLEELNRLRCVGDLSGAVALALKIVINGEVKNVW